MDTETKRNMLISRIHNLANDLRSNIITWEQFDASVQVEIDSMITYMTNEEKEYQERKHYREVIKSES